MSIIILSLLGLAGAGKGTVVSRILKKVPEEVSRMFCHLSSGDALRACREMVDETDSQKRTIGEIQSCGGLVSNQTTILALTSLFKEVRNEDTRFVLLDGFPRRKCQVPLMEEMISNWGLHSFVVQPVEIHVRLTDAVVRFRRRRAVEARNDNSWRVFATRYVSYRYHRPGIFKAFREHGYNPVIVSARDRNRGKLPGTEIAASDIVNMLGVRTA